MMLHIRLRRISALALVAGLVIWSIPAAVAAHSELQTSDPAAGATVASPFSGPIVLTFSEHLASGSKADLLGPDGATIASATVDADAKTMTIALTAPLDPGAYQVRWVSIADDGDVLRQPIVTFTVAAAPSPSPSPTATPTASPTATAVASAAPTAAPSAAPSIAPPSSAPSAAPSGAGDPASGSGDVLLPIIVALVILGAGAFYLLSRRNRPPDAT